MLTVSEEGEISKPFGKGIWLPHYTSRKIKGQDLELRHILLMPKAL
jgi:hypothetical protein